MSRGTRVAAAVIVASVLASCATGSSDADEADEALEAAMDELVGMPSGPPGVVVVVQRGGSRELHTAGVADVASGRVAEGTDLMRIASVAKAFSGAVALSLVDAGVMSLDDTIGERLPDQPAAFHAVTLGQLLHHTSGVPDFTDSPAFGQAVVASLEVPPPPRELVSYIADEPLVFPSGSEYRYSNSDNIYVGLMVEQATGRSYAQALATEVSEPLDLDDTNLPEGPELADPAIHGYDEPPDPPEDVTHLLAAGWAWASGGVVSTPFELNDFIRGYVGGELFGGDVQDQQWLFIPGAHSEPTGPGDNAAGLALFRYETPCGTVYGHTGNTFGYTQFAAASEDGRRSATVAMTLQRTQKDEGAALLVWEQLRRVQERAVCAAMAGS
jgi:D-alanyl-D-alanine carboxypeptidase